VGLHLDEVEKLLPVGALQPFQDVGRPFPIRWDCKAAGESLAQLSDKLIQVRGVCAAASLQLASGSRIALSVGAPVCLLPFAFFRGTWPAGWLAGSLFGDTRMASQPAGWGLKKNAGRLSVSLFSAVVAWPHNQISL